MNNQSVSFEPRHQLQMNSVSTFFHQKKEVLILFSTEKMKHHISLNYVFIKVFTCFKLKVDIT